MLKKEGTFRVYPKSWTFESYASGAGSIAVELVVAQEWGESEGANGAWSDQWPDGYTCYLRQNVVQKDGQLNEKSVKALVDCGLWNGDFDQLKELPPRIYLIVKVEADEYQGKTTYKAEWPEVNADKPTPRGGGFKPADPSLLSQMRSRHGSGIKALLGGAPAAGSTPPAPPPSPFGGGGQPQQQQPQQQQPPQQPQQPQQATPAQPPSWPQQGQPQQPPQSQQPPQQQVPPASVPQQQPPQQQPPSGFEPATQQDLANIIPPF